MALDKEFFAKINLSLRKKKYYDAAEVEALLERIRWEADNMRRENASMRKKLEAQEKKNAEVADALIAAQDVCRKLIDQANLQAAQILADAETKGWDIRQERVKRSEYAVELVEECMRTVQEQQEAALRTVKEAWQRYLCGLYPDEEDSSPLRAPDPAEEETEPFIEEEEPNSYTSFDIPQEMKDSINRQVFDIKQKMDLLDG